MNTTLQALIEQLTELANQLESGISDARAFNIATGNWSFPGLSKADLISWVEDLAKEIKELGPEDLGRHETELSDYVKRLAAIRSANTVGNLPGNAVLGVAAIQQTLDGLHTLFRRTLPTEPPEDAAKTIKRLTARLAAMETRLKNLEPRAATLDDMLCRIEAASSAADALPEDLATLATARNKVASALEQANTDAKLTEQARQKASDFVKQLEDHSKEAKAVVEQCDAAYSAATSQGLAKAFSERSTVLSVSMWFWAAALAGALWFGVEYGGGQLSVVAEAIKSNATGLTISAALVLAVLKLGGPVWFAWLSTKQIGQRFRLSEDYAFKASISRAYEGYRKEAARIDPEMAQRLLASALDRLDEQPLRLVEQQSHGSPWQEALNSDVVRKAAAAGPDFARQLKELAASFVRTQEATVSRTTSPASGVKTDDE